MELHFGVTLDLSPLFFGGEGMMLGLDPLFILAEEGSFVVHHTLTQGGFGVTAIVWRGKHPNFLGESPQILHRGQWLQLLERGWHTEGVKR